MDHTRLLELTAGIVSATYAATPDFSASGGKSAFSVGSYVTEVYGALAACGQGPAIAAEPAKPAPAVSIRSSIKPDHLVSLIDGSKVMMLKRHLTKHGYTPETYREAFGLARDYPMVAPNYAEKRRNLALKIGLGRKPVPMTSRTSKAA